MYEYISIDIREPQTCASPCEVTWDLPLRGIPLASLIKQCPGGPPVVRDRYLTTYLSGANLPGGTVRLLIGDSHPGREQVFCARLLFLPLPEEED